MVYGATEMRTAFQDFCGSRGVDVELDTLEMVKCVLVSVCLMISQLNLLMHASFRFSPGLSKLQPLEPSS